MTASSHEDDASLAELREELAQISYRLHHYERDYLEYGVPVDRDTLLPRDRSGRSLADLDRDRRALRVRISALEAATPRNERAGGASSGTMPVA